MGLSLWMGVWLLTPAVWSTPANRAALEKHYENFLAKSLTRCTTCHLPSDKKFPENLEEFPHNSFGRRLRQLGDEGTAKGRNVDLPERLAQIANEDTDGDGVPNQVELLLGHNPGDPGDRPTKAELEQAVAKETAFARFLASYRWQPFEPVHRPALPETANLRTRSRNPIDLFLAAERDARGLTPRPEAPREVLLRRVYLDLIGLNPTPEEQRAFLNDSSPEAYERVVDRLLLDPRHGERWARHWMDIWRYSDWAGWTDGGQIRDSQRHIWHWRDWIVEALNADKPYDRMLTEMLAADEVAPDDGDALRATGFLARNYKMLSREQWLEDTLKHTSQALLGVTLGCAKCHDHMVDPISQREYYALRAVFEPHQVRTDRLPGELDLARNGLPRVYDATNATTYILVRGDERHPLTNESILPGVPAAFGGRLEVKGVPLPWLAGHPDDREFVLRDTVEAGEKGIATARTELSRVRGATNETPAQITEKLLNLALAEQKQKALLAVLAAERRAGRQASLATPEATNAVSQQRLVALAEATLKQHQSQTAWTLAPTNKVEEAKKKLTVADKELAAAAQAIFQPLDAEFTPREVSRYPTQSTGRRLALARWMTDPRNPLVARVAVNHVWLRHFGRGLVPTPADFGRNGRPPTHPQLLDWLAAEFMQLPASGERQGTTASAARPWSFRQLHRLIVTSAAYRMASTPDAADLAVDPDNQFLWRMNSHRLEAEAVRDNVLFAAGTLDNAIGGPEVDHMQALTSPRRSLYLRQAAEKQAEFLQIFDGPAVTECYERRPSVMPQQALALNNSELALHQARVLADRLLHETGTDASHLINQAFQRILARLPTEEERRQSAEFLATLPAANTTKTTEQTFRRTVENFVLVLFNHNDFVTVR